MNPRVFWGASLIVGLLLVVAVAAPGQSDRLFQTAQAWVIDTFGWFYILSVGVSCWSYWRWRWARPGG